MTDRTYGYRGAIVCWKTSESNHRMIADAVANLGPQFKECRCGAPTPASAMRWALSEVVEPDVKNHKILVRDLKDAKDKAFVVVQEDPKMRGDLRFRQRYIVMLYSGHHFDVSPALSPTQEVTLREKFIRYMDCLPSTAVGVCLADVIRTMGAIPLRESGGVYWVPEEKLLAWKQFAAEVERAGENKVYNLTVQADDDMIRCVADNLVVMATGQIDEVMKELDKEEISEATVKSRQSKLDFLYGQVRNFEEAFQYSLDCLKPRVEEARSSLALYNLMESSFEETIEE